MLRSRVLRSVNDAQVLASTALRCWLNEPPSALGRELKWLNDGAFSPNGGNGASISKVCQHNHSNTGRSDS